MPINKKIRYLLISIQIIALVLFTILNLGMVFSKGVCCADDSFHAHIAKNLADGLGYASTLPLSQVHYTVTPFDPELGTGPTLILPAAMFIKIFGNSYWVPGLTEVVIWCVLLFCIGVLLNRMVENKIGLTIGTLVFFFFCYTFTAYHSEQWWALLGEIPAVLLIILAILVYFDKDSKGNLLITGLLFSLAYQSKNIVLLPFGIFLLSILILKIFQKKKEGITSYAPILKQFLLIAIGFLIPIIVFELWKLVALKSKGYLEWWSRFLAYFTNMGIRSEQIALQMMRVRIETAIERFGFYLPILLIVLPGIGWAIKSDRKLFHIFLVLALIIGVFTIYWLFLSIGWPRYYVIPLILITFVLTFPFLSNSLSKKYKYVYVLILGALSIFNAMSIRIGYPILDIKLFRPNERTLSQKEVVKILTDRVDQRPFYTQFWATAVDLEYLLDTHLNFDTVYDPAADFSRPFVVVVHKGFLLPNLPEVSELLLKCNNKEIGQYIYAECPPQIQN